MTDLEFTILKMFMARDERLIALIDQLYTITRARDLIARFNRLQAPGRPN